MQSPTLPSSASWPELEWDQVKAEKLPESTELDEASFIESSPIAFAALNDNQESSNYYISFTNWCKSLFQATSSETLSLDGRIFRLISREQNIANTFKNLNVVKINSALPVRDEVTRLISELEKVGKLDSMSDIFTFAEQQVDHRDRFSLLRLNVQFHGKEAAEWKEALYDNIAAKKDSMEKRIHICHLLQQSMRE